MTPRVLKSFFAVIDNMMPPRDPNDDEEEEAEDENDNKEDLEPPVVREPDEE
jgi:hypothetical protein